MEVTATFKGIDSNGKITTVNIAIDFDPSKYIVKKLEKNGNDNNNI